MNKKLINNMTRGVFTPIDYSKPRFETKVDVLKDLANIRRKKAKILFITLIRIMSFLNMN